MEYFDSCGFKNRKAEEIVFQSLPWSCSREAPNPLCEASVFTLVLRFTSKWVFLRIIFLSKMLSYGRHSIRRSISYLVKGEVGSLKKLSSGQT